MKTVEIRAYIEIPDSNATDKQIQDFVEFNLGYVGGLSLENPLCDESLEVKRVDIIEIK